MLHKVINKKVHMKPFRELMIVTAMNSVYTIKKLKKNPKNQTNHQILLNYRDLGLCVIITSSIHGDLKYVISSRR